MKYLSIVYLFCTCKNKKAPEGAFFEVLILVLDHWKVMLDMLILPKKSAALPKLLAVLLSST